MKVYRNRSAWRRGGGCMVESGCERVIFHEHGTAGMKEPCLEFGIGVSGSKIAQGGRAVHLVMTVEEWIKLNSMVRLVKNEN